MANDTETRLQFVEAELNLVRSQLASIADNTKRIMEAVAGPLDGSRAGLAEHCRDYGQRLARLEEAIAEPRQTTKRDVAIAGGAGGLGAFLLAAAEWILTKLHS